MGHLTGKKVFLYFLFIAMVVMIAEYRHQYIKFYKKVDELELEVDYLIDEILTCGEERAMYSEQILRRQKPSPHKTLSKEGR